MGANAVNETDLSALNMLLMFPSEGDHGEIMDILSGARALRARDMSLSAKPLEEVSHNGRIGELQGWSIAGTSNGVSFSLFALFNLNIVYSNENPLHIASAQGHVDFIREVLRLKPEYAKEVKRWFNPLHMAAANGHIEVVKELMNVDPELWSGVEGKGNKTRFHFAIMKGRINVINEMLSRYEGCIQCATVQRESALQLAVKDSSLKQLNLFLCMPSSFERIGRTWTVRQVTEITEILRQAGAVSARDVIISPIPSRESHDQEPDHPRTRQRCQRLTDNLVEYFNSRLLLIIAVLVTTATFQVGLSPPGGTCQDSYFPNPNNGTSGGEAHIAGTSIMGTNSEVTFALFMVFNSMDFSMSLSMINILTSKFPLQFELQICMVALFFTYNTAMTSIAPSSVRDFTIIMKSVLLSIILTLTSAEKYFGNYPQSSAWPGPSTHLSTL
ncbi:hypothetical protein ES332_D07G054800v1 [Gossypium tomentosum]|uniref:PGG domain-containing protein n=1 Tax=Gossypium tomentosum TaxID=34277 RepID=A0A5D2K2U7_GOSTO|nr:hypothetical protein ES332_D07G054800v1 [Gossypium tomentosum]